MEIVLHTNHQMLNAADRSDPILTILNFARTSQQRQIQLQTWILSHLGRSHNIVTIAVANETQIMHAAGHFGLAQGRRVQYVRNLSDVPHIRYSRGTVVPGHLRRERTT